jgi:hypothetical protein
MELVVTQPKANSALQSDLAAVMGGCADGTTGLPALQDNETSTPE